MTDSSVCMRGGDWGSLPLFGGIRGDPVWKDKAMTARFGIG